MKNILKTLFIGFVLFFSALFINIDGAKATEIEWCDEEDEYEKAASCSYANEGVFTTELNLEIYFAKTTKNKYCAAMKNIEIDSWVDFTDSDASLKKSKVAFDLEKSTVKNIFSYSRCPQLKFVNDYEIGTDNTTKFTVSGNNTAYDTAVCSVSAVASFGSECWVLPGKNFKTISGKQITNAVKAKNDDENPVDTIYNWGQHSEEGNYGTSSIGNPCSIISAELKDFLTKFFWIIDIIAIILLIVMTMVNFIQAITGVDDEKLKNTFKYLRNRLITVAVLLLLPLIIGWIIDIINDNFKGEYVIGSGDEPLCSIAK